jgi:hypothetical protein
MKAQITSRLLLPSAVLLLLLPAITAAQPDLNFKRVRLDWPYVELYFSVGCNGIKDYALQPKDVRVYEDGREVTDFGLWCPDPTARCPITVGLVFDASDSMTGEGSVGAKHGGATFIGNMDDVVDEACVIHFNQSVWVYQPMTTDTVALKAAVSLLPSFGATALWDGIFTALAIVQNNGSNQCRAVIVLSDGEDNSSTRHGLPDVIAFAVRHNIRVFPIGYGKDIAEDDLRMLAELSGGVYYQTPNASELAGIYREISTILYDFFQECVLRYDPRCGDDLMHDVELKITGICGGDATFGKSYFAPRDSTSFKEKYIGFAETSGMGGGEVRVPIELRTPFFRELLYPLTITTNYDRKKLELVRVETPPGTLLAGMNVQITDVSYGGTIRFPESRVIDGTGILGYAVFRSVIHSSDMDYQIRSTSAVFDKGCLIPVIEDGTLHLSTSRPLLQCDVQAPASAAWNPARHRYEPDPFLLRIDLSNAGTIPASGGMLTLEYDANVFELLDASPLRLIDTLHASGQASLQWRLSVKPQASTKNSTLCVVNSFTGVEVLRCCASVDISAAGMLLGCGIDIPAVLYQAPSKAFSPNPFDIVFHVDNPGVISSGNLSALLQLPEGLYVESGEVYEKPVPSSPLSPGENSSLSWRVRLISQLGGEVLPLRIELRNDGVTYRGCTDTLVVPWIPPTFEPGVVVAGPTTFCEGDSVRLDAGEGYTAYKWNTGENTRFLTVRTSGSYFASVRSAQGDVGQSKAVIVTVHPRPSKPVIAREHNTLVIGAEDSMQWFRNGSPVDGAVGSRIDVQQTGAYTVRVRNAQGCTSISDPFFVNVLSAAHPASPTDASLTVHPHPAHASIQVRMQGLGDGEAVTLRIIDLLGRVREERSVRGFDVSEWTFDVRDLPPGIYLLTATGHSRAIVTKFLTE